MTSPLYCCNDYMVDSDGFIISKRGKPMKPSVNARGYLHTSIMLDKKPVCMAIHIAVARTFLGDKSNDGLVVNHKDGNKTNNRLENLEWITPSENTLHAYRVLNIRENFESPLKRAIYCYDINTGELIYSFESITAGAEFLVSTGVTHGKVEHIKVSICRALNKTRKTYLGCTWEYVNKDKHKKQNVN